MSSRDRRSQSEDGWAILRAGDSQSSGLEIPTLPAAVLTAVGPVRFALGRNGEARVLLPLADGEAVSTVVGAPALDVSVSTFSEGKSGRRFLDLTCMVAELETVFREVVDQILARVEKGSSCVEAARSTIEEFRALLLVSRSSEITGSQIAGLVGELLFLKRLTERSAEAWKAWRGPAGDRHDFARAAVAVEVKVTTRKGKQEISINGVEQLAEPAGGELFLVHYELEAVASGMLSVSALAKAILAEVSDPQGMRDLLAAGGCDDVDNPAWNRTAFRLENESFYRVASGFPRIVPSEFEGGQTPQGISQICYTSDLSAAAEFRIAPALTQEIEGRLLP